MYVLWARLFSINLLTSVYQLCSAVAVARLLVGAWHVLDHLRVAVSVFRSETSDVSGSASGIKL